MQGSGAQPFFSAAGLFYVDEVGAGATSFINVTRYLFPTGMHVTQSV